MSRRDDIVTPASLDAMPDGPDKAVLLDFRQFLRHHGAAGGGPGSAICSCGVAARREGTKVVAVPNPACECPCHQPGYATDA